MLKRLLPVVLAAGVAATGASAQPQPQLLMPGVTYDREAVYTLEGRVVTNVVTAPRPGGLYSLEPALAGGRIHARDRLTTLERRLSSSATVAGLSGETFPGKGPNDLFEQGGVLQAFPDPLRSSLGIRHDGTLALGRVPFWAEWRGTGAPEVLRGLNRRPHPGWTSLYTNQWGSATPATKGTVEAILNDVSATVPGQEITGTVVRLAAGGGHSIPPSGAVLMARGGARAKLRSEARPGTVVTIRLFLLGGFGQIANAMGGGPALVRNGRAVFNPGEPFDPVQLARRVPRAAVGQRSDGSILLVSVDGGRAGYSVGVTNWQLAQAMQRLGAVIAIALGSGRQVSLSFDGGLLSRPAGSELPVSSAVLLSYTGVQAPLPSAAVFSPNGDGVDDLEQLAYKVVAPSHVTATLNGPGGATLPVVSNQETGPGTYTVKWDGTDGHGRLEPEGAWTWNVRAVDTRGSSQASRDFSLNTTLTRLQVAPAVLSPVTGALSVDFDLLHPAAVTLQVETRGETVLRKLPTVQEPAGHVSEAWDGAVSQHRRLPFGSYRLQATAVNAIGTMDLVAPFRVGG